MSAGQQIPGKFTCLFSDTELRGVVASISGSTFDVTPDANYGHLVANPYWTTVHCETYSTACRASPEWEADNGVMPMVTDGGSRRGLQTGDRIVVRGAWVYDNVIHQDEAANNPNLEFYRGTLLTWRIKTELHPYIPGTIALIHDPGPGDANQQTLTVVAPRYTEVYADTHGVGGSFWNTLIGMADHIVQETVSTSIAVNWMVAAPPLPTGGTAGVTHELAFTEEIAAGSNSLSNRSVALTGSGLGIQGTLVGTDILNPARFQAKYTVFWRPRQTRQLASFYASESIALARFGNRCFADAGSNSLDASLHSGWALSQSADDAHARLSAKIGEAVDARGRQGNLQLAQTYAGMAVHLIASGGAIGLATGPAADDLTTLEWVKHRDYALNMLQDPNAILPGLGLALQLTAMEDALWARFATDAAAVLRILFTSEAVYLAQRGGYQLATRNDASPANQRAWAEANSLTAIRDELKERYRLQYLHQAATTTIANVADFYAGVSIRLNAFGVDFGSVAANSPDLSVHQNWAMNVPAQSLIDETIRRVTAMFATLTP